MALIVSPILTTCDDRDIAAHGDWGTDLARGTGPRSSAARARAPDASPPATPVPPSATVAINANKTQSRLGNIAARGLYCERPRWHL